MFSPIEESASSKESRVQKRDELTLYSQTLLIGH